MSQSDYRILIIDKDGQTSRRLCEYLVQNGFEAEHCQNGETGVEKMKVFKPRFVVCDLMLSDMNATEILNYAKKHPELSKRDIKFIITSSHNSLQNVRDCIKMGACDYIIKPLKPETLLPRLIFQAQKKRELHPSEERPSGNTLTGGDLYLHLLNLVLKESISKKSEHEILFSMSKMLALALKAVRCSVIQCMDDRVTGYVRVSHDNIEMNEFKIDLDRYPEVLDVMNKEEPVVIENLDSDPVLAEIKKNLKSISFNSMIVCPVYKRGNFYGVISARMGNSQTFTENHIRFALMLSNIVSLILSSQVPLPIEFKQSA
jgi:DNA-binding response OmpR family regulator